MKKNLFFLFALICSMSLFTACSDDDPNYTKVIENEIAGNYKGMLEVSMTPEGGSVVTFDPVPQKITVTKASATAISLSITDFSFLNIQVGDINLDNCPLTQNGATYGFNGTTQVSASALTADVKATGTISNGTIRLDLDIAAAVGGMQQDVTVTYTGTKLNGTEGTGADITAFTFDSEAVTEQPVINGNTITFKVLDGADISALAPTITVSEGATVTPASGVAQDFSNNRTVTYTVVSEDYGTTNTYSVSVAATQTSLLFSFENWEDGDNNDTLLPEDVWASSADGASLLGGSLLKKETNEDGTFAAKMMTFEYPGQANSLIPKITAGSIFMGTFNMLPALMGDRLSCTEFGVPAASVGLTARPVRFKGMYKYTAGETYLNATDPSNIIETEDVDQGSIVAVLYKAKDESGADVTLTGHDVNTSEHIVAYAMVVAENNDSYQTFDVEFTDNGYEAGGDYKFAIVCSSSIQGDTFKGAGGSTLIVDELEVIAE